MNVKFFDIVNDEVVINPAILLIPEFEALNSTYKKDAPKILAGIHWRAWPSPDENPYYNIPELIKDQVIERDFFKGRVKNITEPVFVAACEKMETIYDSTILRFHVTHKQLMEDVGIIMGKPAKDWPDNMTTLQRQLKEAGTFVEQFVKSQNAAIEEMSKTKGDLDEGYDEGKFYSGGL